MLKRVRDAAKPAELVLPSWGTSRSMTDGIRAMLTSDVVAEAEREMIRRSSAMVARRYVVLSLRDDCMQNDNDGGVVPPKNVCDMWIAMRCEGCWHTAVEQVEAVLNDIFRGFAVVIWREIRSTHFELRW